jgi:DNA-directed RNA polymerase specialized sigma24 family protein
MQRIPYGNDPLLACLIEARDETARSTAMDALAGRAAPLIEAVLSRYSGSMTPDDLADLRATALMRLVRRLDQVTQAGAPEIRSLDDFVATLAFNVANDWLRERFPARTRLKNRIRYVLAHSSHLASWRTPGGIAAGLAAWRDSHPLAPRAVTALPAGDLERALAALFQDAGAAMLLEDAVNALSAAWGIVEPELVSFEPPAPAGSRDQHDQLEALWIEIRALRPNQRAALLLNLRDPAAASAIELFVLLGVATIDELAAALEMTPRMLAAIWNTLPLDDNTIAARLGVTRQQVINLRRAARERLGRRFAPPETGP